jgi:fatty-acyl-CoA synthase
LKENSMDLHDWNIGYVPKKRAFLTPDKNALIYEDRPLTYQELNDNTNRIASLLQGKGIRKGDRIAVLLRDCCEIPEVFFAAAKLGIIFLPLNFRLAGPELEHQLNDSGSRLIVFHDLFGKTIGRIQSKVAVEKDKFFYVRSGTSEASGCPEWAADFQSLINDRATDEPRPDEPVSKDDPLAILYTSGTTGVPKGAVVSHLQTYFKCFQVINYFDMREEDVLLSHLPLCHSAGLFINALPTLCRGGTLILRQKFEAERFAEDIERYKATIVNAFNTVWKSILQSKKLDRVDMSSVRVAVGGGERTPQSLLDELAAKGIYIQLGLGQTENSFMLVLPKEDAKRKAGSIGLPGLFTDVWIADKEGRELPANEVGEIVARGPTVMSGYWNMPGETARVIVGGVLHTGDLGYRDEEGYFYFVDREKDAYRSGGENVYPAEIEKVLANHPKVFSVAIIGVPHKKWGETGMALIVPKPGEKVLKDEIFEFLQGRIAKFKFPTYVEFVDELPMTASGRIKKVDLKEKYGAVIKEGDEY